MNKKIKLGMSLITLSLMLTACIDPKQANKEDEELKPDQVTVNTTSNQISDEFYRAVIVNGKYPLGVTESQDTGTHGRGSQEAFEQGLLDISKKVFPTDQYYLQEGQLIDADMMTSWVSRESEANPAGLNPELPAEVAKELEEPQFNDEDPEDPENPDQPDNQDPENLETQDPNEENDEDNSDEESTDEDQTNEDENGQVLVDANIAPIYLNEIMEKNILVETDEGYALSGIVIGLSMNSEYEYTDREGTIYRQEISLGEMRERGRQYANVIVGRLRNTEELRSIPIVVGIYASSPSESIVGGTYLLDGISREGNAISDWEEHNEYRVALPAKAEEGGEQHSYFNQFSNEVYNFFPNLNGISGEALYVNNGLTTLKIEIVTQFYQQTEIAALTQHVTDVAQRLLPEGVSTEIIISSTVKTEAFIKRPADSNQFQATIFR